MIYSNYDFLVLLPALLALFYCARKKVTQRGVLLIASFIFLGWTTLWNLLPVAIVIIGVYAYLKLDERYGLGSKGTAFIVTLLVVNLAYFRYRDFIGSSLGIAIPVPDRIAWVVPLGISFYTFEAISAVLDIRRRRLPFTPTSWALFIMFLPHLIAGPIVRFRQLAPQFEARKLLSLRNFGIGMHLFTLGFIKKLAADPLGQVIDPIWATTSQASALSLVLAILGFYAQLYLDFSGYTDMGRGVARMLGYRLPINFRAPYFSATPSEFYQRWHVSLSSWIRTFVYDTLAVAVLRRIKSRRWQNYALLVVILFVMALFGLWHGSAWHFVFFGVAQGAVIAGWVIVTKGKPARSRASRIASILVLQATWLFSLVLFRAGDLGVAWQFLTGLFRHSGWSYPGMRWCLVALAGALLVQAVEYWVKCRAVARRLLTLRSTRAGIAVVLVAFVLALSFKIVTDDRVLSSAGGSGLPSAGFIYFRF